MNLCAVERKERRDDGKGDGVCPTRMWGGCLSVTQCVQIGLSK